MTKKIIILELAFMIFLIAVSYVAGSNSASSEQNATMEQLNKALDRITVLEAQVAALKKPQDEIVTKKLTIIRDDQKKYIELSTKKVKGGSIWANIKLKNSLGEQTADLFGNESGGTLTLTATQQSKKREIFIDPTIAKIPYETDWELLTFSCKNTGFKYLTDKIISLSMYARVYESYGYRFPDTIHVSCDTLTQQDWNNYYMGSGKFKLSDQKVRAEYQKCGENIRKMFVNEGIKMENRQLIIDFMINGYPVGKWTDGTMKLEEDTKNQY